MAKSQTDTQTEPEHTNPDAQADQGATMDADAAAALDGIADEEAQAERDQERQAKGSADPYPYDEQLAGALEILSGALFSLAAARLGPHWRLSREEGRQLSVAGAQAVEHYWGDVDMGPGVNLVFVAGGIVGPRAAHTAMQRAQTHDQETSQEGGDAG